ncbi:MAG TPA: CatA-like O-acetyltransferase [Pyrinomonadaceae bacterium]|nr:CatA-like O-acetyltransferase [Pyrinomonadaceae bacterium]
MFTELDIETWPRKATYEFFRDYDDPFFNFAANIDITRLYRFTKENNLSISLAALFNVMTVANEIREFRIRLLEGRLVEFDCIHATQTILNDDETFSFAYFEMEPDMFKFDKAGRAAVDKYKRLKTFDVESDRVDLIYFSVIPWVSFTSFKHATRLDRTQTVPRIVFGKIFEEGPMKKIPLSVEANHTIMDGLHVGKLFNGFQELIARL